MKMLRYLCGLTIILGGATPALAQAPPAGGAAEPAQRVTPSAPAASPAFLDGAKVGYVDLGRVASLSRDGRAATAKLEQLRKQKGTEVAARGKQVDELQAQLTQGATVLSAEALAQLKRQFERAQVDFQRFTEDAQVEVNDAQQQMQRAFAARLFPVIGQVAEQKNLWAVFTSESGLIWHHPAVDLSEEVAKQLDAAPAAATAPPPSLKP